MITINRLKLVVFGTKLGEDNPQKFGFDMQFKKGLNIVAGNNTSGKTTVMRCIYYAFGMEMIISGKVGYKAMDRALLESFSIDKDIYKVNQSYIYLMISNDAGDIFTLRRDIYSYKVDTNKIYCWNKSIHDVLNDQAEPLKLFLQSQGDNTKQYGFYKWLATFAGMDTELVTSSKDSSKTMPLYLQTIFSVNVIEQTKGWANFFNNILNFGILFPKQKIIEYTLKAKIDNTEDNLRVLANNIRAISLEWDSNVSTLKSIAIMNGFKIDGIDGIDGTIKTDNNQLAKYNIVNIKNNNLELCDIIAQKQERQKKLLENIEAMKKNAPSDNQRKRLSELYADYQSKKEKYQDCIVKITANKKELYDQQKEEEAVSLELAENKSFMKVGNIVNSNMITMCPTCHQALDNIHGIENFKVGPDNIANNVKQLTDKEKLLSAQIEILQRTIHEREIFQLYLLKAKNDAKEAYESFRIECGSSDVDFSQTRELIEIQIGMQNLKTFQEQVEILINRLEKLGPAYAQLKAEQERLKISKKQIQTPIGPLLSQFRTYLHEFGYTSNNPFAITLSESGTSNKYMPCIYKEEFNIEEDMHTVSSASDLIRSIWAYYLALLKVSKRNLGFLLIDEPEQQAVKMTSLNAFMKACAQQKDKQLIIACSTQYHITKRSEEYSNKENVNLNEILEGLEDGTDYTLYKIDTSDRCIRKM